MSELPDPIQNLLLIAGPCVAENREVCFAVARVLKETEQSLGINLVFKASYIKANRSSGNSYRGPGLQEGLKILRAVKEEFNLPVLTDIHETGDVQPVAEVADILQIPAFLCRQTALLEAAADTGKWINVKKGQFLAPWDMRHVVAKIESRGNSRIWLTERGTTFGYNNLVVDYRSLIYMLRQGYRVIFDATHSVQMPAAAGDTSGGDRSLAAPLAMAAGAIGVPGFFFETHPDPDQARSDGPNSVFLKHLPRIAADLLTVRNTWKQLESCTGSLSQ